MRSTGGTSSPQLRGSGRASRPRKALSGCGWGRVEPGSSGPSLERRLWIRQRACIRVDGRGDSARNRAQVVAVAEREVVQDRNAERLEMKFEHVLHRAAAEPRFGLPVLLALVHLADHDACDALELSGVPELRQHSVDVPGRAVHVLEEEDRAVELDLPWSRERLAQEPEAAPDERRGCLAAADRADVRIVRARRYLAERLRTGHGPQEALLRPVAALRTAHPGEAGPVERDEAGALADCYVKSRDVGVADERLRVLGDRVVVEVGDDLRGSVAAAQELDDVDLRVSEQLVDVACASRSVARDEVVVGVDAVGKLDAVAALFVPANAAVDLGALLERTGRGGYADRPSWRKRPCPHKPVLVSDTVPEVSRHAAVPLPRRNCSERRGVRHQYGSVSQVSRVLPSRA